MASRHPPTPEAWAGTMLALLALCTGGTAAVYFLGALIGRQVLWLALLLGLAAVSVVLRYLASPGRPH